MNEISNSKSQTLNEKILVPDGIEVSVFYSSKVSRGVVISSDLALLLSRKRVITSFKELPSVKLLLKNKYLHSYFFRIEGILNKLNIIEYLPTLYTEYLNMYSRPLALKQSVIVPDDILSDSTNGWLFPISNSLTSLYPLF